MLSIKRFMSGSIVIQSFLGELLQTNKLKFAKKSSLIFKNKEIHMRRLYNSNIAKLAKDF